MVDFNAIQATIDAVLTRDDLTNSTIELQHFIKSENDDGEDIFEFDYQEVINGIVLDYTSTRKKHDRAGLYEGARYTLLLPSSCEVGNKDKFIFKGKTFIVEGMDETFPNDIRVLLKVFVSEE